MLAVAVLPMLLAGLWMVMPRSGHPTLIEDLGDDARQVSAFQALDRTDDPKVVNALLEGLSHADPRIRGRCARLLSRIENSDAMADKVVPVLKPLLDDPDRQVRMQAANALVQMEDLAAMDQLIHDGASSPHAREAVARVLAGRRTFGFYNVLITWIKNPAENPRLREMAGTLLAEMRPCTEHARIRAMCEDPALPAHLRKLCLRALGGSGGHNAFRYLSRIATDATAPAVLREGALNGLGQTGDARSVPILEKIFRDVRQPDSLRVHALEALGTFPSIGPVVLLEALQDDSACVRMVAAKSLQCMCVGQRAIDALRAAVAVEVDECVERVMLDAVQKLDHNQCAPPR
jgi:HEAT repeat protein